jgi:hypothetical protein
MKVVYNHARLRIMTQASFRQAELEPHPALHPAGVQYKYNTTPRAAHRFRPTTSRSRVNRACRARSALLPPRTTVAGNAPEELVQQVGDKATGGVERATTGHPREGRGRASASASQ